MPMKKKDKNPGVGKDGTYHGNFMKKRALVDKQLFDDQGQADFSYAQSKWKWIGEEGTFEGPDLQAWFKVFDQTAVK